MARQGDPTTFAGPKAASFRRAYLLRIDILNDPAFVTNKDFDIAWSWDGGPATTFVGVGTFGGMAPVVEAVEQQAKLMTFQLAGLPTAQIPAMRQTNFKGRAVQVWYANLDAASQIAGTPVLVWDGLSDQGVIKIGTTSTIEVTAHDRRRDWQRERVRRFTNEDHQSEYPGDLFFEFVPQIAAGKELK